jgi:hypothetical protein
MVPTAPPYDRPDSVDRPRGRSVENGPPRNNPYPVPLIGSKPPAAPPTASPDPRGNGAGRVPDEARRAPSILVHGSSRALVNLVLYSLAEDANPQFHWLDVRADHETASPWDPVRMGWLDGGHVWSTDAIPTPDPTSPKSSAAMFELVRSDEPPLLLSRLAVFLRLPSTMQEILALMPPTGGPNLLAVANADRISGAFPDSVLPSILDAFEWLNCSLLVGHAGARRPSSDRFTHILRVEGKSPAEWSAVRVHFERVGTDEGPRDPEGTPPTDLPFLEKVFRRAVP